MRQFQRHDIDITTIFFATYQPDEEVVFLHSSQNQADNRYSVLAHRPFMSVTQHGDTVVLNGEKTTQTFGQAVDSLRAQYDFDLSDWPIQPEFIGFMSYEQHPARFAAYDEILLYDHVTGVLHVAQFDQTSGDYWVDEDNHFTQPTLPELPQTPSAVFFDQVREAYMQSVEKMREYMIAGDIYVANLTQQLTIWSDVTPLQAFATLLQNNPAPFGGFYQYPDWQMTHISNSVERFVRIDQGRLTTKPIKGTIARGETETLDQQQQDILANSRKDRSELLMVTDLLRNDVSRISEPHTVKVPHFAKVETFAYVHQLVTTITSQVKSDFNFATFIQALFPGGSITGTPKRRAQEIIAEIERQPRGIYTGMQGWLSHDLNLDMNIAIRTLSFDGEKYQLGIGGGITYESDPAQEFDEILVKAKPFLQLFHHDGQPNRLVTTMRVEEGGIANLSGHIKRLATVYRQSDLKQQLVSKAREVGTGVLRAETDGWHWWFSQRPLPQSAVYTVQIAPDRIPVSKLYQRKIAGEVYQKIYHPFTQAAQQAGFDDVLFHIDGLVTELSVGNLVARRGNVYFTPDKNCLRGTAIQDFSQNQQVIYTDIDLKDLATYDALYMINAVRGLVPITLNGVENG
jgi:para-aminobenzoate synthetase/4-amino-4-deoxychorismate lyase